MYFTDFIALHRVNTAVRNYYEGRFNKVQRVLDNTVACLENDPSNMDYEFRERIAYLLGMAHYLLLLGVVCEDVVNYLLEAQTELRTHYMSKELVHKRLRNNSDQDTVGTLDILPVDVRRQISKMCD
jgi:hypothetical protein